MTDVKSVVDALVNDPNREGWRGNTSQWAKRAKIVLNDETRCLTDVDRRRIAACIGDFRLLRPDLVMHCPVHTHTVWDSLYADVCHVVVTQKPSYMSMVTWVGALAYYVRHNPRMGIKRARQIVSPGVATLSVALANDVWNPNCQTAGESTCAGADSLHTRTVLVLLSATLMQYDVTTADEVCSTAVDWLCKQPLFHFCDRLLDILPDTPMTEALQCKRHKPRTMPVHKTTVQVHGQSSELLAHTSLRFFDNNNASP